MHHSKSSGHHCVRRSLPSTPDHPFGKSSRPDTARGGVGSKGTQPMPSNHTSGHACAFLPNTLYDPLPLS